MKTTLISIAIAVALIGGAFVLFSGGGDSAPSTDNVTIIDGKQIITIDAKGRYNPRLTAAKAGIPTIIRMNTQGTFDCTAALTIPALNYQANLPPSGSAHIEVPPQEAGSKLNGICAMGMYNFEINFQS